VQLVIQPRRLSSLVPAVTLAVGLLAAVPPAAAQIFGMSEKKEIELGRQMHVQIVQTMGVYNNPELQEYVNSVGQKLAKASNRPNLDYKFTVLDTEDVNAFAIPGGFVYISRGILPYLSSEAELAAVLGHEIGHVTARHASKQQSQGTLNSIAGIATAIVTGQPALAQLTNVAGEAVIHGYGRDMELEADRLGAEYLARTGYDPNAVIRVVATLKDQERFEVESAKQEGRQPHIYHGLFATHPDNDTRLRQAITSAQTVASHATGKAENEVDFMRRLDGVAWGTSREQGVVRGSRLYHSGLGFTVAFPSGWNVENGQDRVIAVSKAKDAMLMMQSVGIPPKLSEPHEYVTHGLLVGQSLRQSEELDVNGLAAYTAVVGGAQSPFGLKPARIIVIKYGSLYYQFIGVSRGAGRVPDADRLFLSAAQTFRRLRSEELERAEPDRIRVVEAGAGTTIAQLADGSPLKRYPVEQLRLFNRLYPKGEPVPGQLLKIVR
jgi:predicted Zn-dependent protease